jgi:uncharacterized protein YndB with AHSA1/START domain
MTVDVRSMPSPRGDIVKEAVYPHPLEVVWRALTQTAAIADWLMPNDFEPTVGHRFQFRTKPQRGWNGVVDARVLEVDPPRRLSYTWSGGWGSETVVTFVLEAAGERTTRLRLEHTGFAGGGVRGRLLREILARGWGSRILARELPAVLDRLAAIRAAA